MVHRIYSQQEWPNFVIGKNSGVPFTRFSYHIILEKGIRVKVKIDLETPGLSILHHLISFGYFKAPSSRSVIWKPITDHRNITFQFTCMKTTSNFWQQKFELVKEPQSFSIFPALTKAWKIKPRQNKWEKISPVLRALHWSSLQWAKTRELLFRLWFQISLVKW